MQSSEQKSLTETEIILESIIIMKIFLFYAFPSMADTTCIYLVRYQKSKNSYSKSDLQFLNINFVICLSTFNCLLLDLTNNHLFFSYLPNSALSLKSEKLEKFSWLMTEFRRYKVNGLKIEFHIVKALNQKKFGHIIKIRLCMAH